MEYIIALHRHDTKNLSDKDRGPWFYTGQKIPSTQEILWDDMSENLHNASRFTLEDAIEIVTGHPLRWGADWRVLDNEGNVVYSSSL